ncbi:32244_t:CDS:1, partial [Gigaspora margarita]
NLLTLLNSEVDLYTIESATNSGYPKFAIENILNYFKLIAISKHIISFYYKIFYYLNKICIQVQH